MVKLIIKGDWNILKGKLKQKFGRLTHDDLTFLRGKQEELIGQLQLKIAITKWKIRQLLRKL